VIDEKLTWNPENHEVVLIRFFLKKIVRHRGWTCRDSISLILGTRIGSLKHLKNPDYIAATSRSAWR